MNEGNLRIGYLSVRIEAHYKSELVWKSGGL